ncbi:MAG: hypothetical protein JRF37_01220, partial [Deltaproteobacteria bacterium]|nr:hypothetical protein [Deltaproteobacteria bacterium]
MLSIMVPRSCKDFACRIFIASNVVMLAVCFLLFPESCFAQPKKLTWEAPKDAQTSGVVGYRVFCRQERERFDYSAPVWEGDETSCTVANLKDDVVYYFVVRAVDKFDNMSGNSNEAANRLAGFYISGPGWIKENSANSYTAVAKFKDGTIQPATKSNWAVDSPFTSGTIVWNVDLSERFFQLIASEVPTSQKVTIEAEFTFDVETIVDERSIWLINDEDKDDIDNDGMPNYWEARYDFDPLVDDAGEDADNDCLTNLREYEEGTDPTAVDTDMDGSDDEWEIGHGFDPIDAESRPQLPLMAVDNVKVNNDWKYVELHEGFSDPVVVAKPISLSGTDPAVVRIRNVASSGFEIRVQEWDYLDGVHSVEEIGYLVMESGSYVLSDGSHVEARKFSSAAGGFEDVLFEQSFRETPVVVTTIAGYNDPSAVTSRVRNISKEGFKFRMQGEEASYQHHARENISYIAWEPSYSSIGGMTFEIGRTGNAVQHRPYDVVFDQSFDNVPTFLADMQTCDGGDTANLRWQDKN